MVNNALIESKGLTNTTAEQQSHQVPKRPFNIKFNGVDGEYGNNSFIWLLEVERHREKESSPSMCLQHIDRHLEGEAAHWVLNTPDVRVLIYKGYMGLATELDLEAFHRVLTQRFKPTVESRKEMNKSHPRFPLSYLKQAASESLEEYYRRARDLLIALHGRDDEYDTLTPLEISLRSIAVMQFVSALREDWPASEGSLQSRLCQQQVLDHRVSLYKAFKMAEAESKAMESEKESKQKGKRKVTADAKDSDNAKKQKLPIIDMETSEPPTPHQYEVRTEGSSGGESGTSGDDQRKGKGVAALPLAPLRSKPAIETKPTVTPKQTVPLMPSSSSKPMSSVQPRKITPATPEPTFPSVQPRKITPKKRETLLEQFNRMV